jgi:membrane associated rhomboid family serine protease
VNWIIILANAAVFAIEISWAANANPNFEKANIFEFGLIPGLYFDTDFAKLFFHGLSQRQQSFHLVMPFFSYMFLHGGIFHLFTNMLCLWVFGDNVEDRFGHLAYLLFYLAGGVFAAGLHLLTNPWSQEPIIGASGAIAAVMGAYIIMYPHAKVLTLIPLFCLIYFIDIPAFVFLGFWFLLQILSGLASLSGNPGGGVAWWAHIGGFAFGVAVVILIFGRKPLEPQAREPLPGIGTLGPKPPPEE